MDMSTGKQWMELVDIYERVVEVLQSPRDMKTTGRQIESTNMDPWDSLRLENKPRNTHMLNLGLSVHM